MESLKPFRSIPSPTPYGLLFPKIGVRNLHPKLLSVLSQERLKMYLYFKFGRNIHKVHPNKSIKHFVEKGAWAYPGTAQIFWVPPIISGTGKANNLKFCTPIHSIHRKKNPLKFSGTSSRWHSQALPKIFRALIYRTHRAVIFAIAQLSC